MYRNIKTLIDLKKCKPEEGLALLEILNVFSGKWKILILGALNNEEIRFTDLKKMMPAITSRMLSRELKDLEMSGLIKRTVEDSGPQLIKYGLTDSAKGLGKLGLMEWALEHRKISKASLLVS